MKKRLHLILVCMLLGATSWTQESQFSTELPEVRLPFICENEGKMVYYEKNTSSMSVTTRFEYHVVDTKNPATKKQVIKPKVELSKGDVIAKHVQLQGNVLYEFYDMNSYPYTSLGSCIVRRDINTFEQIGSVVEIKDHSFKYAKVDEEGVYFMTTTDLFRYDLELNQLWTKNYDLLAETSVNLSSIEIDENLNVLMTISITEQVKSKFFGSTPTPKSALMFIITDLSGDAVAINPEIPRNMSVRYARFNYNEMKKELTGVFILDEMSPAYVYVKWDVEGAILTSKEHSFGKEIVSDQTNVDYAAFYKINMEKYPLVTKSYNVSLRFLEDGSFFYIQKNMTGYLSEFVNSKMMFLLSPTGDLVWGKVVPYNSNGLYSNSDYYIHDGKIHILVHEFTESYATGSYKVMNIKSAVSGKTVLYADRVFDLATGDEVSNKPLVANPNDRFIPSTVIYNKEDKVIVRYSLTIKNLEQFYTIKL